MQQHHHTNGCAAAVDGGGAPRATACSDSGRLQAGCLARRAHSARKGVDGWSRDDIVGGPRVAVGGVADSINRSLANFSWPVQLLVNLQACLGKPSGGERTVSKTPFLYRMACRVDHSVAKWEEVNNISFDSAGKGRGALGSALLRGLRAEVAVVNGAHAAAALSDYDK